MPIDHFVIVRNIIIPTLTIQKSTCRTTKWKIFLSLTHGQSWFLKTSKHWAIRQLSEKWTTIYVYKNKIIDFESLFLANLDEIFILDETK